MIQTNTGSRDICAGNAIILSTLGNYASYRWANSSGGTLSSQTTLQVPHDSTKTLDTLYVFVRDANGCTGTDSIVIRHRKQIQPPIMASGPTTFCEGDSVILDGGIYATYLWTPGNDTTRYKVAKASGTYVLQVTDQNGCFGINSIPIRVHPKPKNFIIPGDTGFRVL